MTRSAKIIVIVLLALLAIAGGVLLLRGDAQGHSPGKAATTSGGPPTAAKVAASAPSDGAPSVVDRSNARDPGLAFPADFRGTWAPSPAECEGANWVAIDAVGFRAPDSLAVLREPVRIVRQTTPGGETAATFVAHVDQMSEGQEGTARVRMSRAGEHLYMSNADAVGEAEHWQMRNVRCPETAGG